MQSERISIAPQNGKQYDFLASNADIVIYGGQVIKEKLSAKSEMKFWAKVKKSDSCWEWIAALNEKGYGVFGVGKQTDKAHRIAWRLLIGEIPKRLFVCHKCDNPKCVRPNHLFLGTNHDNVKDMIAKGRNSPPPPMAGHNKIELSRECISKLGSMPDYKLALRHGVSKRTINRNRRMRGIPSYASVTGKNGKFQLGAK